MKNIEATATAGLTGDEALLGMTFLRKVKLEQEDGIMTTVSYTHLTLPTNREV